MKSCLRVISVIVSIMMAVVTATVANANDDGGSSANNNITTTAPANNHNTTDSGSNETGTIIGGVFSAFCFISIMCILYVLWTNRSEFAEGNNNGKGSNVVNASFTTEQLKERQNEGDYGSAA